MFKRSSGRSCWFSIFFFPGSRVWWKWWLILFVRERVPERPYVMLFMCNVKKKKVKIIVVVFPIFIQYSFMMEMMFETACSLCGKRHIWFTVYFRYRKWKCYKEELFVLTIVAMFSIFIQHSLVREMMFGMVCPLEGKSHIIYSWYIYV